MNDRVARSAKSAFQVKRRFLHCFWNLNSSSKHYFRRSKITEIFQSDWDGEFFEGVGGKLEHCIKIDLNQGPLLHSGQLELPLHYLPLLFSDMGIIGGSRKGQPSTDRKRQLQAEIALLVGAALSFILIWNLQMRDHSNWLLWLVITLIGLAVVSRLLIWAFDVLSL